MGLKSQAMGKRTRSSTSFSQLSGELFLTLGVLLLLFAFYEAFWTNLASGRLQAQADAGLAETWEEDGGQRVNPRSARTLELGAAFARIHVPSYGSDWQYAIVEGTDEEALLAGPGRYTDTQLPGEAGNFAVAGHRVGKGAPFNDLGALAVCDAVVIETQHEWITYRILPMSSDGEQRRAEAADCFTPAQTQRIAAGDYAHVAGRHITLPGDVGVLDPVPGQGTPPDDAPAANLESLLTLTTCHPQFSNRERMIVHAMAVDTQPKVPGQRPAVLKEN